MTRRDHLILFAVLISLALAGAAAVLYATALGAATSIDSITYIGAARSLLDGDGLLTLAYDGSLEPMTHYPPFYSLLLAAIGLLGVDPLDASRGLGALFMALNLLLVGFTTYRLSHGRLAPALLAALLFLVSPAITMVHAWAWAEPLFLLLCLLAFLSLERYTHQGRRPWLWLTGIALGLSCLTRYTGLALVATAALWALLVGRGSLPQRAVDALVIGLVGCAPLGLWFLRNWSVSGGLADRQIVYHPLSRLQASEGLNTLAQWIAPGPSTPGAVGLVPIAVLLLALLAGIIMLRRRLPQIGDERHPPADARAALLPGLFVLVYALSLVVSISLFDAHTPLDDRILAPALTAGLVGVCATLGLLLRRAHSALRTVALAAAVLLAAANARADLAYLRKLHSQGAGYASLMWTTSPLMREVDALPPDTPLVSNVPDGIYLLTGRPAAWLPYEVHAGTQQPNDAFGDEVAAMAGSYAARDGRLVYFSTGTWRWYLPELDTLKRITPLETVVRARDGEIARFADAR